MVGRSMHEELFSIFSDIMDCPHNSGRLWTSIQSLHRPGNKSGVPPVIVRCPKKEFAPGVLKHKPEFQQRRICAFLNKYPYPPILFCVSLYKFNSFIAGCIV